MSKTRVLLVDDQALVRSGIRSLLSLSEDIEVVHECGDGQQVLEWLEQTINRESIDAIMMDIRMPVLDGIATLETIKCKQYSIPVLMLTTFDDHELVLKAVHSGAKGYLLKDVSLETLVEAVNQVARGESFIQPAVTERLLTRIHEEESQYQAPLSQDQLSPKEREILRLMAAGCSNREIAQSMHKSEGTIKNQVSSILAKLDVRDRTRAVLKSIELGII